MRNCIAIFSIGLIIISSCNNQPIKNDYIKHDQACIDSSKNTKRDTITSAIDTSKDVKNEIRNGCAYILDNRFNILFMGFDNPIEIVANDIDCKYMCIYIDSSRASIIKTGIRSFIVSSKVFGKVEIQLYKSKTPLESFIITNKDSLKNMECIDKKWYRSKRPPEGTPSITFYGGCSNGGKVKIEKLLSYFRLRMMFWENMDIDGLYPVLGFSISAYANGKQNSINSVSDSLSDKQRQLLEELKPGDKFYIENIKYQVVEKDIRKYRFALSFEVE